MRKLLLFIALLAAMPVWAQTNRIDGNITAAATTCATTTACVVLPLGNAAGVGIQLGNTFTGTINFEATADGSNWVAISGTPPGTTTAVTSATATGAWQFNTAGMIAIRARASALSAGGPSVAIQSTSSGPARASSGGGTANCGTGANTYLAYFTDASTLCGDAGFVYNETPTAPTISYVESDQAANGKWWANGYSAGVGTRGLCSDTGTACVNFETITRSGTAVTTWALSAGTSYTFNTAPVFLASGTTAAPSLAGSSFTNTGLFWSAGPTLNATVNGTTVYTATVTTSTFVTAASTGSAVFTGGFVMAPGLAFGTGAPASPSIIESFHSASSNFLWELRNINAGNAAQASIRAGNGTAANDALSMQANGTGFTTSGSNIQDGGRVRSGSNLAGGLVLVSGHSTANLYLGANDTLLLQLPGAGTSFSPVTDNAMTLGTSSLRFSRGFTVASSIGTTNTTGSLNLGGTMFWTGFSTATTAMTGAVCTTSTSEVAVNTNAGGCLVSSERFKANIENLEHGLDWVMQMRPDARWDWRDSAVHQPTGGPGTAEEMARIDRSLAVYDDDGRPYSINDRLITGVLVKSIQELNDRLERLEAR